MNLSSTSDRKLLSDIKSFRKEENQALVNILIVLAEIEKRRLFSELKYESIFDYACMELKYSEPAAVRRISAMRVLRELPEIKDSIHSGQLSLSNIALAQTMFLKEMKAGRPLTKDQKSEVLSRLKNKSARAAQTIVRSHSSEMKKQVGLDYKDIQNEELRKIVKDLRGSVVHTDPQISLEDLLLKLCKGEISTPTSELKVEVNEAPQSVAAARREVWRRDKSCCVNCKSTYAVEIDHIVPVAVGGASTVKNMRLLCRSCNQRAAIKFYGRQKMASHLSEKKVEYRCG